MNTKIIFELPKKLKKKFAKYSKAKNIKMSLLLRNLIESEIN